MNQEAENIEIFSEVSSPYYQPRWMESARPQYRRTWGIRRAIASALWSYSGHLSHTSVGKCRSRDKTASAGLHLANVQETGRNKISGKSRRAHELQASVTSESFLPSCVPALESNRTMQTKVTNPSKKAHIKATIWEKTNKINKPKFHV